MVKFNENYIKRIEWLNDSMKRRFHISVELDLLAVLQLYMQVETRGFLVRDCIGGKWFDCPENITLHGLKLSEKGLTALREGTTTP